MKTPQRYAVVFPWRDDDRIEIVYWLTDDLKVMGEAYFKKDDMCAPIVNAEFQHPFNGNEFKLSVPLMRVAADCVLEEKVWKNVGRNLSVKCENQQQ